MDDIDTGRFQSGAVSIYENVLSECWSVIQTTKWASSFGSPPFAEPQKLRIAASLELCGRGDLFGGASRAKVALVDTGVGDLTRFGVHTNVSGDSGKVDGHGTLMAALLSLLAPGVSILSVRHRARPLQTLQFAEGVAKAEQADAVMCAWSTAEALDMVWTGPPLFGVRCGERAPASLAGAFSVPGESALHHVFWLPNGRRLGGASSLLAAAVALFSLRIHGGDPARSVAQSVMSIIRNTPSANPSI